MKFNHNGIGKLADAQSCTVTEKRNGSYELKLVCPADGIHAEMLEEGNIILAKPSDTMQSQPFRIYKITTPIDGKLEVQARHISYQLNFITVSPFSVTGCAGAMQGLKSHAASDCPFDVWTDVDSSATFTLGIPSSFRNCLGGMAGSVLDVFGGEFEWDRYTVKFHKTRGADHNVHIIYGKNLTDFKMEKSIENTITGAHPYWVDNEIQAVMELPEKVVLQSKRSIPYQKITVLDCTSNFQEKPSEAALREYAQNYIDTTDLTEPEIDIKIDFLQLWNTLGYEDIVEAERVSLCDTVHVFISKLGIEVSSKVTETEYDALLERYNSITLSNSTVSSRNSSLTGSLNSIRNTATIAYDTAVRAETAVGEQVGGITASIIYDGALFAALFGLHYKNETDNKGNTTRYAFNAATLKQSTVAWKNSSAGLFVSTDGGKTWGYGWEADDTAVRTAILLEQTLKELDDRYKKATELSEELLKELDERYKTATAISAELQKTLDQRYETAKKLSKDLYEELDKRYGTLTEISEDLQKELDERYSAAKKLSEEVEKELDEKYQPSVPVSETAPEAPAADTLWVDKKNLRLKLWDGEQWQTIGHEPEQPTEPTTPTEPEKPEPENPDTEGKDNGNKEETDDKKTDQEGGGRVMVTSIYQKVELSLTENLIPVTVPVKQYDNKARKVRCVLYNNSVQYSVPQDCIVACSGTRPDGTIFHYTSETASDLVFVENGAVVFTITTFMTAQAGRFPLDVVMLSTAGDVLGSFSLTLKVERAAINNGKIATYTYAGVVEAIRKGLLEVYITDDGYFAVVSEDGLGFSDKSESSTIQKFIENLLNCTVTDDGYLAFTTEDGLKLIFSMDGDGRLIVEFTNG
jgi:phage minor structural protein